MKLPILPYTNNKTKKSTIVFNGLNQGDLISDNELSGCENISLSRNTPLVSCRLPREVKYSVTTPNALFSVGSEIVHVDGTDFKYKNATKGTVTSGTKSMVDFNGKVIIMPDKKYYDYSTDVFNVITDVGAGVAVPDMDYICIHMNRIFGVKGSSIYATALGQYNNWTTFAGESTDAWAKDVASEGGDFTGIVSYQNHPILFKKEMMYELYNNKPDYVTQPVNKIGCLSSRAIVEANSILYFVGSKGVYAYTGGVPRLISNNLNETYSDAVLGTDGKLLYVSLYNGTVWNLYVYDTQTGLWVREDNLQGIQFTKIGEHVYCLAKDGKLYKFNSGTENNIEWYLETKNFTEEIFNRKGNGIIRIRIELESGSSVNVYTSVDDRDYKLHKSYSARGTNTFSTMVRIQMSDSFRIKLSGKGNFKLYAFGREIVIGQSG